MQALPNKMGRRFQKSLLTALAVARSIALGAGALALSSAAMAFQIAPMGLASVGRKCGSVLRDAAGPHTP